MSKMRMRAFTVATAIAVAGGASLAGPMISPASAKSVVKVCVNKKSGDMKIRNGNKCAKGWKKMQWNKKGPQGNSGSPGAPGAPGATGPAGPELSVKDKDGNSIGTFMGYYWYGPVPVVQVLNGGGIYSYSNVGVLQDTGDVYFLNSECSGTPYYWADSVQQANQLAGTAGGVGRAVTRSTMTPTGDYSLGAATAYKLTGQIIPNGDIDLYRRSSTGSCYAYSTTDTDDALVAYEVIQAPNDVNGPLTVG